MSKQNKPKVKLPPLNLNLGGNLNIAQQQIKDETKICEKSYEGSDCDDDGLNRSSSIERVDSQENKNKSIINDREYPDSDHDEESNEDYFNVKKNKKKSFVYSHNQKQKSRHKNANLSIDMFEVMKKRNTVHQAANRLTRQPAWKWSFEEQIDGRMTTPGGTIKHDPYETQKLKILAVTWNLHGKRPQSGIDELLKAKEIHHDMYVISTQECMRTIATSMFAPSKQKWEEQLQEYLGNDYVMVTSYSLQAIHLIVFLHISLTPLLTNIKSDYIATGISNILGNKGAVGISFNVGKTSILCISCHLAAGQQHIERRNKDFSKIYDYIVLGNKSRQSSPSKNQILEESSLNKKQNKYDVIIWSGDFNYRINGNIGSVKEAIKQDLYDVLKFNDQFYMERLTGRVAQGFQEGEIEFAPTYKLVANQDAYNVTERIPGWTDRIIYQSKKNILQLKSYDSNNNMKMSDHRPVFAQFELKFRFNEDFQEEISSKFGDLSTNLEVSSKKSKMNTFNNKRISIKSFSRPALENNITIIKVKEKQFAKSSTKACTIF